MVKTEVNNVNVEELIERFSKEVQKVFSLKEEEKEKNKQVLLTRKEAANLLHINLSTLHNYCKQGKIHPLGLGKRVYFKKEELLNSLIYINK